MTDSEICVVGWGRCVPPVDRLPGKMCAPWVVYTCVCVEDMHTWCVVVVFRNRDLAVNCVTFVRAFVSPATHLLPGPAWSMDPSP